MNILFDIGHPAHVHLYRYVIQELSNRGHNITITVRDIPAARRLLDEYGFEYLVLGSKRDSLLGKLTDLIRYDLQAMQIVRKKKIDIGVGSSIVLPHMSVFTKMKSIVLDDDDDEVEPLFRIFAHPFATVLLSPDVLSGKRRRKDTLYYPGYHELAYLHPSRFQPDVSVLDEVGVKEGETFFLLRFNAFKAHHDRGIRGLSPGQKEKLISKLKEKGRVLITSERNSDPVFDACLINVGHSKIHSLMYYATMFIGDSQTMSSEAAVLGTPSLRLNSFAGRISYLEEEEHKYGLTFAFTPDQFDELLEKAEELLARTRLKEEWQKRRKAMLAEKIDLSSFLAWFIQNYPESMVKATQDRDFMRRFSGT